MQQIYFDLDFEQTNKMQLGIDNEILSYTDNEIQVDASGTSVVTLEADGLRMGTGQFNDSGARMKYNGNIPFNHVFMVVKENRLGTTQHYDKALLSTHEGMLGSVINWANGVSIALNNTLNLRSIFRKANNFVSHLLNIANLQQRSATPTVSFQQSGNFKIVKLFLTQSNSGNKLIIGSLEGSVNTTSYSQATFKRLVLANGTQAEGDAYFQQLKTQYSL